MLLLDEPFGALDAQVRVELRDWLRRFHDEQHVTTLLVTHDQAEAMEVSDQVVVMHEGRVAQTGTVREIYDRPTTPFVAAFVGGANVIRGQMVGGRVSFGALSAVEVADVTNAPDGSSVNAYVRPHDVALTKAGDWRAGDLGGAHRADGLAGGDGEGFSQAVRRRAHDGRDAQGRGAGAGDRRGRPGDGQPARGQGLRRGLLDLRVTTRTRYAIRALYHLAFHRSGQATQAKEIAEVQKIPLRFLEQILQDLRRAGLIEARRGPRGGYALARPPAEISMADVLRAVRGPLEELLGVEESADGDAPRRTTFRRWSGARSARA